jgi:hypothetical protein
MPEVNFEWVRQQLQEAKAKIGAGNAAIELLKIWSNLDKLSEKGAKEAVEIFAKLAFGKPLTVQTDPSNELWIPAQPGQLTVGDEVRVLPDAYADKAGLMHNGRRGKIVAIRYGDVIFKSTDGKQPVLDGIHYSPYKLEKRVR